MWEPDMESAFNAELARQLAANCGAAVDRVSRERKDVTLEVRWDPASMKAVVTAWYHQIKQAPVAYSFSIGTAAADIDHSVSLLPAYAKDAWLKANRPKDKPKGIAPADDEDDDDIPF